MDIKVAYHNLSLPIPSKDTRPAIRELPEDVAKILKERHELYGHRLQIFDAMKHWHEHGDITISLIQITT